MTEVPGPDLEEHLEAVVAGLCGTELDGTRLNGTELPGIGVDVEDHARWRSGDPRLAGLFTEAELARCRSLADPAAQLAGTWCAKEAAVKAMASSVTLSLRDVEVVRDDRGRPAIRVLPSALRAHGDRVRVSISRTRDVSVAVALYLPEPSGDDAAG